MGEERLKGLVLNLTHRDIVLDLEEIIDLFATRHSRRMKMINILCGDE